MIDLISQLASDSQGGATLVLAVVIFSLVQYLLNKQQTKTLGSNHIGHLKEDIFSKIDLHEQWERETAKQTNEILSRIEISLARIDNTLSREKRR